MEKLANDTPLSKQEENLKRLIYRMRILKKTEFDVIFGMHGVTLRFKMIRPGLDWTAYIAQWTYHDQEEPEY